MTATQVSTVDTSGEDAASKRLKKPMHDAESLWIKVRSIGPVIAITVAATLLYTRIDSAVAQLQNNQDAIAKEMGGVRDDLRRVFMDNVATRQAQQWIELARALNRAKYPDFQFPDLPR